MVAESGRLDRTAGSERKFLSRRRQLVTRLSPVYMCQLVLTALAVLLRLCQMCIFLKRTVVCQQRALHALSFMTWRIVSSATKWRRAFKHTNSHFSSSSFLSCSDVGLCSWKIRKKSRRLLLRNRLAVRCGLIPASAGLCRLVIPRKCAAAVLGCGFGVCACTLRPTAGDPASRVTLGWRTSEICALWRRVRSATWRNQPQVSSSIILYYIFLQL